MKNNIKDMLRFACPTTKASTRLRHHKAVASLAALLLSLTALPSAAQDDFGGWQLKRRPCGTSFNLEQETAKTRATVKGNYVKHSGDVAIPVILVNYSDVKLTVNTPQKAFDQMFNGTTQEELGNGNHYNHGSVAQYFSDMSTGEYRLKFKVYEPVTLPHEEGYYGGTSATSSSGEKHEALVVDAVNQLVASGQVTDSDIESFCNGGSTIDCVYIIYAGVAQNVGGEAKSVWANTNSCSSSAKMGGKSIRYYSMAGELYPLMVNSEGKVSSSGTAPLITGIGVTCHEFTHALGIPDFYPISSSAYLDNQEMEYWDLMDGGEYVNNGFCPTAFTAFEKQAMGWPVTIEELTESKSVSMTASTELGGKAYKIVNPNNSNEYLLLECIQKTNWNSRQAANGLMVYHVNVPSGTMDLTWRLNDTPHYPGMAVVPADGACLSSYIDANEDNYYTSLNGDLFPGTGGVSDGSLNVSELSDTKSQPNFCWYNTGKTQKLSTNKALQNIVYDSATRSVSFNYIHDVASAISSVSADKTASQRVYTLDGRYVGTDINSLPKGLYVVGGKKVVR